MRRRDVIAGIGTAAAWPLAARAQQGERVRRVGVLLNAAAQDFEYQAWLGAFLQGLELLGWDVTRNVRIDTRWATADAAEIRRHAAELAMLAPDVILASGGSTVAPLLRATRSVPVVFPVTTDPVAAGFVDSLARLARDRVHEFRVQHRRKMAGATQRDRAKRDTSGGPYGSGLPSGPAQFEIIRAAASSLRMEANPVNMRDPAEIERGVAAFARAPNGGLIVTALGAATLHRGLIITLAAAQTTRDLFRTPLRRRRRPCLLWAQSDRSVSAGGGLRRSHPQGREASGPARTGADKLRVGDQFESCKGARPHDPSDPPRPR